ncbi:MAG: LptA/OstA family protein [Acidobacteriota bacterium]|nr:LptA/OstA family protein [Acidobacteriota bacterium]
MTRSRHVARAGILALVAGFTLVVVFSYSKPGARTEGARDPVAETLLKESGGKRDTMRFRDFQYDETRASEGRYRVRATEAVRFEEKGEKLFRLKDVVFESREGVGERVISVRAPRAEMTEGSRAFRIFDGVRIDGEETSLSAASFRYDPVHRLLASEGPVAALRGALVAHAASGKLGVQDGNLVLDGDAHLSGRSEGGRALDLVAPHVVVFRDGRLDATGGAVLKTDRFVLRSESVSRLAEPEGSRLRAATDAFLLVLPDGDQPPAALTAQGEILEVRIDASGQPSGLEADGGSANLARLDLGPAGASNASGTSGARRARAPHFTGRFENGRFRELTVPARLDSAESGRAGGPAGSGLRTLTAGFARVLFLPDGRSIETAVFENGVQLTDGKRAILTAPHGSLRGRDDTAVFSGEADVPARYHDERGTIAARSLSWNAREEQLDAAGAVKASYAPGSGPGRGGFLGGDGKNPFFSESDSLRLLSRKSSLVLTGSVRAWQNENVLRCGTLELDDAAKTMRATQKVQAFFRRETTPAKGTRTPTGGRPSETINAAGDVLIHREEERFVRLEGHATMTSGIFTMSSDVTDIRLSPDRTVEYTEARGAVVVEDRAQHRRGEGTKAIWRPETEAVTLEGSPATALDGKGNRSTGAVLTFRQKSSQVDVETDGSVPTETILKPEGS